jgi:hypothetical protein
MDKEILCRTAISGSTENFDHISDFFNFGIAKTVFRNPRFEPEVDHSSELLAISKELSAICNSGKANRV